MLDKLKIVLIDINEIKPYEGNAKTHDVPQIKQIKASIKRFHMIDPIGVHGTNNTIVEGHGRYIACKQLGYKQLPCIRLDHLTEEERKAYTLAHNKLTMNTDFDFDILGDELESIVDIDMSEFGFDLDDILGEESEVVEEDDFDVELPEEPKSKLGEIYQLGSHKLMCGDSTKPEDVEKLMGGVKADMVFTDPPYGYEYQSNMRKKSKKFEVLKNDDKILDFLPIVKEICRGFVFVCTTWKVLDKWTPLFKKYYELTNMIIWDKGGGGIGDLEHTFLTDYEIILCSNNGSKITGKRLGSVWNLQKDNAKDYIHATQKPVKLSATAIENTTNTNNIVVDLFGGSGSTLIACEQLNRKCYMMELDCRYIDVIINRWEEFTGQKAVKIRRVDTPHS